VSLAEDIQILAFHEVMADTPEYRVRYLHRWYSKEYHIPLNLVKNIPLPEILQDFWETRYENMDEHDRDDERVRLLETEDERRLRMFREDAEKAEGDALLAEVEAAAAKVPKKIDDLKIPGEKPVPTRPVGPDPSLDSMPKFPDKMPENVSIKFFSDTNFFNELVDRLDGIEVPKLPKGEQS